MKRIFLILTLWFTTGACSIPLIAKYGNGRQINLSHAILISSAGPVSLGISVVMIIINEFPVICIANCKGE